MRTILFQAALAAVAVAVPLDAPHVLHEKRHAEPKHWVRGAKVPGRAELPVRIGMKQSNLDGSHDLLMEVSSPHSPKYGQYYSAEEVADLFAPSQESIDAVNEWLVSAGISRERIGLSANRQWVSLDMAVTEMEELLRNKYYHYTHKASGKQTIACDDYHVPSHIQEHIDYITPGIKLLAGGKASSPASLDKRGFASSGSKFSGPVIGKTLTKAALSLITANPLGSCDSTITPECIAAMYNITKGTLANKNNKMGIFEEGDFYSETDLAEFFALIAPNIPATTMPVLEGIDGGFAPSAVAGGESNLDLMISYPIIYPQNSIIFQTDDIFYASGLQGGGGFLNTFLDAIDGSYCNYTAFGETGNAPIDPKYPNPNPLGYQGKLQCGVYKPSNVISISYGEQEDDLPTNYQQRQCSEFMKLGMQGTSVFIASGDSGVAARGTDDGNANGCLGKGEVFNPDFPASCPYITAVGATLLTGDPKKDQEVAVTRFPSGGGFSNIYPRPDYQNAAVNTYLTQHNPSYPFYSLTAPTNNPTEAQTNGGRYNRAGRGYPDVSAVGDNVIIILNGAPTLIGGTSASAPVFGAIINRVNEARIAMGKSTVGFVNPVLYSNPQVLHDITVGNNSGCGTPGFFAAKDWDPVTGLGTPNFPAILKLYTAMP